MSTDDEPGPGSLCVGCGLTHDTVELDSGACVCESCADRVICGCLSSRKRPAKTGSPKPLIKRHRR